MTDPPRLLADPSPRLVSAYREIERTRMRGLPFLNPALEVEAVDFDVWQDAWLGVLVTPWCMNLMLLPRDLDTWRQLQRGAKVTHAFPAGAYEFVTGEDPALGPYRSCSLFSPVTAFASHADARLVASLARAALFDAANAEVDESMSDARSPATLAKLEQSLDAPLSKRDLLHGRFRAARER